MNTIQARCTLLIRTTLIYSWAVKIQEKFYNHYFTTLVSIHGTEN
ncbi:hypothetical protein [Legionella birminghamensis]|nr:hypothetical protein [Legionella birminghamensis]